MTPPTHPQETSRVDASPVAFQAATREQEATSLPGFHSLDLGSSCTRFFASPTELAWKIGQYLPFRVPYREIRSARLERRRSWGYAIVFLVIIVACAVTLASPGSPHWLKSKAPMYIILGGLGGWATFKWRRRVHFVVTMADGRTHTVYLGISWPFTALDGTAFVSKRSLNEGWSWLEHQLRNHSVVVADPSRD